MKYWASAQEVICEHVVRPSHLKLSETGGIVEVEGCVIEVSVGFLMMRV